MPVSYDAVDRYIADHLEESLADLERLVRIPSVSAKGEGIATIPFISCATPCCRRSRTTSGRTGL